MVIKQNSLVEYIIDILSRKVWWCEKNYSKLE